MKTSAKILAGLLLAATIFTAVYFSSRDELVMVYIEESSSSALTAWPLAYDRQSEAFLDIAENRLILPSPKNLWGVSLGTYYSAFSAGVEYHDELKLLRGTKTTVRLDQPLSFRVTDLGGVESEAVDNACRVTKGAVEIKKIGREGAISVAYGGKHFELLPGEAFTELLALTPQGEISITEDVWEEEVDANLLSGCPMTRVHVLNLGLWPKARVISESVLWECDR